MLWADSKGLSKRQFAHFAMLLLFYLTSFSVLTYFYCIIASLLGTSPVNDDSLVALAFILPFALANEVWLLASNYPYNDRRQKQRHQVRDVWRARVLWTGMSTVFAKAIVLAVLGGPNRKPTYKVTRKEHDLRWHWRETLPHIVILLTAIVLFVYALVAHTLTNIGQITVTLYFGSTYFGLLAGFVNRGRHGVKILRLPTMERRRKLAGSKPG
jgi:cellulose synthase (UDP-forming)